MPQPRPIRHARILGAVRRPYRAPRAPPQVRTPRPAGSRGARTRTNTPRRRSPVRRRADREAYPCTTPPGSYSRNDCTGKIRRRDASMKSSAQVVVIGGGVVGTSVLYHLTELGWTDVVLVERKELTAGSTWHAAGGMHTLNGDPNVAKLQQYTVGLYREIEQRSGQNCSIHMPGGLMLAGDRERMDWLRMAQARGRYLGMDMEIISAAEAKRRFPLLEEQYFIGALFDRAEGHVDPTGVTRAYAGCARQAGAEICQHTWVSGLRQRPDGTWDVITDSGEIHAEHIVNAGGLWAREVGRMIGLELPVLAMEHMYLITQDMDEVAEYNAATGHELPMGLDFDGELYIRQEGGGMLFGTYEQACVPWSPRETPWTFDQQLLAPDLDRLAPSLEIAFKHYPALAGVGIKKVINGPFTFAPDGNPLVGPVPGVRNCWVACAVLASRSRAGWSTAIRVKTSGRWTWPASATGRASRTPMPRCGRATAAGSVSPSPTRNSRPAGRCIPPLSMTGSPPTTRSGVRASGSSIPCGSSGRGRSRART